MNTEKITLKTFKSEFLPLQVELGNKIWEKFSYGFYSSLEQLEASYQGDGFDPELKLYSFNEGELIGFVTAKVIGEKNGILTADIAFPHVKDLDETVTDVLYNEIISKLKEKGVQRITARAGNGRRNTLELVEKYGFEHVRDQVHLTWLKVSDINIADLDELEDIKEFDFDRDIDIVSEFFSKQFNMAVENARTNFESIRDMDKNYLLSHVTVQQDGKIIGRGFLQQLSIKDKQNKIARLSPIIAVNTDKLDENAVRKGIFRYMVNICKEKGIENLNISFVGVPREKTISYKFLNSEFYTISIYQKDI